MQHVESLLGNDLERDIYTKVTALNTRIFPRQQLHIYNETVFFFCVGRAEVLLAGHLVS
jgi:hypothetical protein